MYYIQNSRREFEVSMSRKEDKRKEPKKIGFYYPSRKERKAKNKVGFYYINLYFRGIVSLRKRINDFRQLQHLHKSQKPLLALLREKTNDKEKEKRTLLETLSHRRKKDREWLFIKRKRKKLGGFGLKEKKDTCVNPC